MSFPFRSIIKSTQKICATLVKNQYLISKQKLYFSDKYYSWFCLNTKITTISIVLSYLQIKCSLPTCVSFYLFRASVFKLSTIFLISYFATYTGLLVHSKNPCSLLHNPILDYTGTRHGYFVEENDHPFLPPMTCRTRDIRMETWTKSTLNDLLNCCFSDSPFRKPNEQSLVG